MSFVAPHGPVNGLTTYNARRRRNGGGSGAAHNCGRATDGNVPVSEACIRFTLIGSAKRDSRNPSYALREWKSIALRS